jgi:vacuolar-type H+-ATPase subunit E/Vma4
MAMSLEKVLDQIRQDGESKAALIRKEGEDEAKRIMREATSKVESETRKMEGELSEKMSQLLDIRLSKKRMDGKRKRLVNEKRLHKEFNEALREKVRSIDREHNMALLNKLLHIAHASPAFSIQSLVSKGEDGGKLRKRPFFLYCNERDRELVMELSDLEIADTIDCLGGIMAEAEDKSWRINLTYDILLDEFYDISVGKVHRLLMGETEDG